MRKILLLLKSIELNYLYDYFTKIFQAEDLAANPTIEDTQIDVNNYSIQQKKIHREM